MGNKVKTKSSAPISIDLEERTVEVIMTTISVDRDGDIVETKGLDTKEFEENPVVLWAHNSSIPPIGKILELRKESDHMRGIVKFAKTAMAEEIFQLYVGGFLKTWSIGFGIDDLDFIEEDGGSVTGYHIRKSRLYELSAVPVPANPEALVRACKGMKDEDLRKTLFKAADYKEKKAKGTYIADTGEVTMEDAEEGKDMTLAPTAFAKTIKEAGSAGKIKVTVEEAEVPSTVIEFEVVKSEGLQITECKINNVRIALCQKDATPLTPLEPSRSDDQNDEDDASKSAAAAADIRELAATRTRNLEVGNFCEDVE